MSGTKAFKISEAFQERLFVVIRGTKRLFSVKYLFCSKKQILPKTFVLLEDGQKFLGERYIHVQFEAQSNKFSTISET